MQEAAQEPVPCTHGIPQDRPEVALGVTSLVDFVAVELFCVLMVMMASVCVLKLYSTNHNPCYCQLKKIKKKKS